MRIHLSAAPQLGLAGERERERGEGGGGVEKGEGRGGGGGGGGRDEGRDEEAQDTKSSACDLSQEAQTKIKCILLKKKTVFNPL